MMMKNEYKFLGDNIAYPFKKVTNYLSSLNIDLIIKTIVFWLLQFI